MYALSLLLNSRAAIKVTSNHLVTTSRQLLKRAQVIAATDCSHTKWQYITKSRNIDRYACQDSIDKEEPATHSFSPLIVIR
jgi:hypothetical protein